MKYAIQTKDANCVPVGVFNMLRWSNIPLRSSDLEVMERKMGTNDNGTSMTDMFAFIKEFWDDFVSVRRIWRPTTEKIKRELMSGNSILVDVGSGVWKLGSTKHLFFISDFYKGKFITHNMMIGHKRTQPLTEKEIYQLYADDLNKNVEDFADTCSAFYVCSQKDPK